MSWLLQHASEVSVAAGVSGGREKGRTFSEGSLFWFVPVASRALKFRAPGASPPRSLDVTHRAPLVTTAHCVSQKPTPKQNTESKDQWRVQPCPVAAFSQRSAGLH